MAITQLVEKASSHLMKTFKKNASTYNVDGLEMKIGGRGFAHIAMTPKQIVSYSPEGDKMIKSLEKKGLTFGYTQTHAL